MIKPLFRPAKQILPVLLLMVSCAKAPETHLSDYVSTLVGTQSEHAFSTGNTYPATALPWGSRHGR